MKDEIIIIRDLYSNYKYKYQIDKKIYRFNDLDTNELNRLNTKASLYIGYFIGANNKHYCKGEEDNMDQRPLEQPIIVLCNQCDTFHPILKEGVKCPMAKERDLNDKEINFDDFFSFLKLTILSKMKEKGIQDIDKLMNKLKIGVFNIMDKMDTNEITYVEESINDCANEIKLDDRHWLSLTGLYNGHINELQALVQSMPDDNNNHDIKEEEVGGFGKDQKKDQL